MDTVANLINQLKDARIELKLFNDQLKVSAAGGPLPPGVARELKDREAEIKAFLRAAGPASRPVPGKPQLDNELKYIGQQLAQTNEGTAATGRHSEVLAVQRTSLLRWSARLSDHYYQVPVTPIGAQAYYSPSASLRHFWIGFWHEKSHVPFNMVIRFPLDDFHPEAFRRTCGEIARRHEIMRTIAVFCRDSGTVKQKILPVLDVDSVVSVMDISRESDQEQIMAQHEAAAREHIFAYEQGPLFYFTVFTCDARRASVLFNVSHAVFDEWSKEVLEEEFRQIYPAYCRQQPHPLKDLPVQYRDYAAWEHNYQQTDLAKGYGEYWYSQSPDRYPCRNLSTHFSNTPLSDFSYRESLKRRIKPYLKSTDDKTISAFYGVVAKAERTVMHAYQFAVGGDTFARLSALCQERSVSPSTVLIAALNVLVYKTTGIRDVVLGANVAIRDREEIQKLVGFFVNLILIRNCPEGNKSFNHLITEVILSTTLASCYKSYTLPKVLDDLDIPFNAINTVFLNVLPAHSKADLTDFAKRHLDTQSLGGFDIELTVRRYANGLRFWCNYDFAVYSKEDISFLFDSFENVLDACLHNPHATLDALAVAPGPMAAAGHK